ncbi:hypothetical protein CsSME_00045248 [Camellia sinensis var. sinensis]
MARYASSSTWLLCPSHSSRSWSPSSPSSRFRRRIGKLMRKFLLPENANQISVVCQDNVFTEFLWREIPKSREIWLKHR